MVNGIEIKHYYREFDFCDFAITDEIIKEYNFRYTVAYKINPEYKRELFIGLSYCHPKEDFVKKSGREIAIQRLLEFEKNRTSLNYYNQENNFASFVLPYYIFLDELQMMTNSDEMEVCGFKKDRLIDLDYTYVAREGFNIVFSRFNKQYVKSMIKGLFMN